jgi:hypothetical protein
MQNLQVWVHWTSKTGLEISWWCCQFLIHFSNPIPKSQGYAGSLSTSTGQLTWAGGPCIQPSSARPRTLNRTMQQASCSTWNLNPTGQQVCTFLLEFYWNMDSILMYKSSLLLRQWVHGTAKTRLKFDEGSILNKDWWTYLFSWSCLRGHWGLTSSPQCR